MNPTRALFLAVACVPALVMAQSPAKLQGKPMPAFKMTDVSTGKAYSNASLKGKVVLLDFWASWCGPCKMASPTMQQLHQKYGKLGLVVIGSNIEPNDSVATVKGYAKEHGYTYSFTRGNRELAEKLGLQGIPLFILIDKKGVVRKVDTGFDPGGSPVAFDKAVRSLLAQG